MKYPDANLTINTLLEAAKAAGSDCMSQHPEDIATAMINAIEAGHVVLTILAQEGKL